MLIPVIYTNGKHDIIEDFLLDVYVKENIIKSFKRRSGWVDIPGGKLRDTTRTFSRQGLRR